MRMLTNERGVALVTSMLLTLVSLAIVLTALYVITQQTQLSAASKRYKTALEAAHGGAEVFARDMIPQLFSSYSGLPAMFQGIAMVKGAGLSNRCMSDKLNNSTANWTNCKPTNLMVNATTNLLNDLRGTYDYAFTLKGVAMQPGFNVYTKLVDTQQGNSDTSGAEQMESGAGVASMSPGVSPKHIPAIYRIEVQGERATNPLERASLTVLYAY